MNFKLRYEGPDRSWKDILQVLVIPVGIAAIGAVWALFKLRQDRDSALRIVLRELKEIAPFPESPVAGGTWTEHQTKHFVHQKWFDDPTNNKDIILRLPEELVYRVNQLWSSKKSRDTEQWLYYLEKLSEPSDPSGEVGQAKKKWESLIRQYETP